MMRQTVPPPSARGTFAATTPPARTAPPGPEPRSALTSSPRSAASRRAFGDAAVRRAAVPSPAGDALTAGAAGGGDATAPVGTPPAAGPTGAAGPAPPPSPGAKISAIVLPTGTPFPPRAVTFRQTPQARASLSTVGLSVSIST